MRRSHFHRFVIRVAYATFYAGRPHVEWTHVLDQARLYRERYEAERIATTLCMMGMYPYEPFFDATEMAMTVGEACGLARP